MVAEANPLITATKSVLYDIAKHAHALATGLQNAAPPQDSGPGKSISYLTEIAVHLEDACRTLQGSSSGSSSEE
jgi:hypothetical protein